MRMPNERGTSTQSKFQYRGVSQHQTSSAILVVPTPTVSTTVNPLTLRQIPPPTAINSIPLMSSTGNAPMVLSANLATPRLATIQSPPAITLSSAPATTIPAANQPVVIGPSIPPIPHDLAQMIWDNKYVEIDKLLPKNLKEPEVGEKDKQKKKKKFKYITHIATWVEAFNVFIGVMAIKHPERVPDLATYSSQITAPVASTKKRHGWNMTATFVNKPQPQVVRD